MVQTFYIDLRTQGNADVVDITREISQILQKAELQTGIVAVFCPSATSGLTTIEYEPGCVSDLKRLFDDILSPKRDYAHNERWGDGNGHSHMRAALLGPSLTIPFISKQLQLGTWQQIIFVDFDVRPRQRSLVAQVMGE